MNRSQLRTTALAWIATAMAAMGLWFWLSDAAQAAMSDCIDATCRITATDGSRGSGCVFEQSNGMVYILTAAHVVAGRDEVACEFWRYGHQSQPLAGRVLLRDEAADAAVVAILQTAFGGVLPTAIPLAPRDYVVRPGETLTSVGCAAGAWSTGWKGHALSCGEELRFVPVPANGRSGSAVFDATGQRIVGLLRARTGDNTEGIATPLAAIYGAFDRPSLGQSKADGHAIAVKTADAQWAQCGPGGCPLRPQSRSNPLLPFGNRREAEGPSPTPPPSNTPWPSLPSTGPSVDVAPLDEKLGRIASLIEELKKDRAAAPPAASTAPIPPPAPPTPPALIDELARKTAEAALGQVAELRSDADRNVRELKAETTKAKEGVGGLTTVVENLKQAIAEDGTLSQRFHARVERVRTDLEEKLGREATDREVRIGYVKDLLQEKIADGGLAGLAKALGLPAGLVLVVWLITRDVKHKRETGDPLVIERLATLVEGRVAGLQERIESLKDRLHLSTTSEPTKVAGTP